MKGLIFFAMLGFICGCREGRNRGMITSPEAHENDSTTYPLIIDGGTKVVYQFGHLTADKGLKLYFDTIPYPVGGLKVDESVIRTLSPE